MSRKHLDPSDDAEYLGAYIEELTVQVSRLADALERLAIPAFTIPPGTPDFTVRCACPSYPPNYVGDPMPPDPNCPMHRYPFTTTWGT